MILGAILAGGQSRRFGSDKALALTSGRPMIDHVRTALQPLVDAIVVCGRSHGDLIALLDRPSSDVGPLGGLNAALHYARERGYAAVISLPCDTPILSGQLLSALGAAQVPTILTKCPVIGFWPTNLAEQLDRYLATGNSHAVRDWAASVAARGLSLPAPINVNRIEDLERLNDRHTPSP